MKKITTLMLACLCASAASAQSAFTVSANDTTYSFPISSTITLTDNALWKPDTIVTLKHDTVAPAYKSGWNALTLRFQSSFSTVSQSNKTGVTAVSKSYLAGDSILAVDFTVDEPKRVIFAAYAKDTLTDDSARVACVVDYFRQRVGKTEYDAKGRGYQMFDFGTAGQWTFLFNEKLQQFAFVNKIEGSPNYALMKDTIIKRVDYSKTIDIENVKGTWSAWARLNGTWQKVDFKLTPDPITDREVTIDGIGYSVCAGRTRIKFPVSYSEPIYGFFPDEYEKVKYETNPDFKIEQVNLVAAEPTPCIAITGGDTIRVDSPGSVSSQDNWSYPTLKIMDGDRFEFENGLVLCKWKYVGTTPTVSDYLKVPAGTILYRSTAYPADTKTDTVYVEKHDTVVVYLIDVPTENIIAAAKEADESINSTTGTYDLTEDKFKEYASYYHVACAKDTTDFTADELTSWKQTLESLRKLSTSYGYYSKKLMNPALTGKYILLGQGNITTGMLFNMKSKLTASTYINGYIRGNASGYVAYAKRGVAISDTTVFKANQRGKHFNEVSMMGAPVFYGCETVDAYVIYSPELDRYTPIYAAANGDFLTEQWKGNTANNYATLEEATEHLGPNTMNMADRIWLKADYDDDGVRTVVVNGKTSLDDLYTAGYKDFSVIATCGGVAAKQVFTEGVTIDTSATPLTFTKDGEACDFSGAAFLKAKTADGDPCVLAIVQQSNKLYVYAFDTNE